MELEKLLKEIQEIKLQMQNLEQRVLDLEQGNFGTGIYLDGCSEGDVEYITNKTKKAGE